MLTPRDHMTLRLASQRWRHSGARVEDIRHQVGMSEAQWAQALDVLIDRPDAEAAYPALVHRLRRVRDGRRAARGSNFLLNG